MRRWSREVVVAVGAATLFALVVLSSLVGYYSAEGNLNGVSVSDVRLNSIYALPDTYGLGMNVSFKVTNVLTHDLNLRSVTYVLSVDGVRVGEVRVRLNVTEPEALEAINKSLVKGEYGVRC